MLGKVAVNLEVLCTCFVFIMRQVQRLPVLLHGNREQLDGAQLQVVCGHPFLNDVVVKEGVWQAACWVVELDESFLEGVVDGVCDERIVEFDGVREFLFDR